VTDLQSFERTTIPQIWRDDEVSELMRLRLTEGRSWDEIARALGRTESGVKSKYKYETHSREVRMPSVPFVREAVPDSVLKEQARRVVAWGERSLTAAVFGDPPPGWDARSRKMINQT
jgi:Myb-like DNA-binding domain